MLNDSGGGQMRMPLYIDFRGKKVAVIGGGGVGTGRAKKFIEAGAKVTVFSNDFTDELIHLSKRGSVKLVKSSIEEMDIESVLREYDLIVVAIGDRAYNVMILETAKKYKTLVNLANDAESTEVVVPFEGGKNGIRFAVTTEGKSGIVARRVRDMFQRVLEEDEETIYFLNAMEHLKRYMKSRKIPVNTRMKLYYAVSADETFRKLVKNEKVDEARKYAEQLVEEYVSGKRELKSGGIEF
jgi:precorrin-2 dehydrogenase/sirohydrochlorin ferrochelatase